MAKLSEDEIREFKEMAKQHSDFLCEKLFKPVFEMAFLHGAKHMKDKFAKTLPAKRN